MMYNALPHNVLWCGEDAAFFDVREDRETLKDAMFKTFADSRKVDDDCTDFRSALAVVAEVCKMEVLTSQDLLYKKSLMKDLNQKPLVTDPIAPMSFQSKRAKVEVLEIAIAAMGRGAARFVLKGLIQNALQVNLHVSIIAITKPIAPKNFDTFNALSVAITILSMLFDIPDALDTRFRRLHHKRKGRILNRGGHAGPPPSENAALADRPLQGLAVHLHRLFHLPRMQAARGRLLQ